MSQEGAPADSREVDALRRALGGRGTAPRLRRGAVEVPVPGSGSPEPTVGEERSYQAVKNDLQERLIGVLQQRGLLGAGDDALGEAVREFVSGVLEAEELPINEEERELLGRELVEETLGLGPLAEFMADPAISDILVTRFDQIYIERFGRLEQTTARFRDDDHVRRIIERLAMRVGRRIDQASPMVDLRLADGSRVNATIPPATIDGPTLSIRRFGRNRLRSRDLLRGAMLSGDCWEFLQLAVANRKNVLISGGTGAGKSTLLSVLAEAIGSDERVITIEDTAELVLDQQHVIRMETRPVNAEGQGAITARELLVNSLRMRPDRIIVGEVRSGEALDMLQAMNTGHEGSLCTLHANSARDALARLETMVLMAGTDLPSRAIREQMSSALDLIVHVRRYEDGVRRVSSVSEVVGMESGVPLLQDLFTFEASRFERGRISGEHRSTGIVPRVVQELRAAGNDVPMHLFQREAGA